MWKTKPNFEIGEVVYLRKDLKKGFTYEEYDYINAMPDKSFIIAVIYYDGPQ